MARKNNDYFELIKKQVSYCAAASDLLDEILCKYNYGDIDIYRRQMHEIEHTADDVYHDILNKLSVEFITPIDQEDILVLVQIIDDITDALDEVILDAYMYRVEMIPERTQELSKIVNRCVKALLSAAGELKNFKKPDELRALLVKVNDIEVEADSVYPDAIRALFGSCCDMKVLLGAKAIYEGLENCCDLCEHAAEVVEQVIIKNS